MYDFASLVRTLSHYNIAPCMPVLIPLMQEIAPELLHHHHATENTLKGEGCLFFCHPKTTRIVNSAQILCALFPFLHERQQTIYGLALCSFYLKHFLKIIP